MKIKNIVLLSLLPVVSFASVAIPEQEQEAERALDMMRNPCKTEEDKKMVKKYVASRVDINKKYLSHESLLHMAAVYAPPKTVSLLIASNANVNAEDRGYFTPLMKLMLTAFKDDKDAEEKAKILLNAGAKTVPPDKCELTLEDLLRECDNENIKKEIGVFSLLI